MPFGPPPASETITSPRLSTAKPNGVAPFDAFDTGEPTLPPGLRGTVTIVFEFRSVTTSAPWSRANETCAGPSPGSVSLDPAIGTSRPLSAPLNPETELFPASST